MPHVLFHHVDPTPKGGYTELPVSSHSSSWKPTSTGEDWDDEADEGVCVGGVQVGVGVGVCVHIMHVHTLHTCKCICSYVLFYIIV